MLIDETGVAKDLLRYFLECFAAEDPSQFPENTCGEAFQSYQSFEFDKRTVWREGYYSSDDGEEQLLQYRRGTSKRTRGAFSQGLEAFNNG